MGSSGDQGSLPRLTVSANPKPKPSRARKLLVRFGPYLISAAVVAAILQRYSVRDIAAAMQRGNAWALFPIAIAFSIVQILLVSAWDAIVLQSVLGGPKYWDVVRVKAGCAVLQSLGYLLNVGAYGTWIARATGSGARVAVALILFTAGSDFAAGAIVASFSTAFGGVPAGPVLRYGAPALALAVITLLLFPKRRSLDPDAEPTVSNVIRAVPRGRAALQIVARLTNAAWIIATIWMAMRAFGLAVPFGAAVAFVPLILFVGSMPVNVLGFGPVQGVWLLFARYADGPSVLAFQIGWNVALLVAYLLRGAIFVPRILREVADD